MGRPPLTLGTYGRIDFHRDSASGRVRARARFRHFDGQCRAVTRWAGSEVDDLDVGSLAPSTRQLYAAAAHLYVQPALGDLRLGELSPALIDRVRATPASARTPASPGRSPGPVQPVQ